MCTERSPLEEKLSASFVFRVSNPNSTADCLSLSFFFALLFTEKACAFRAEEYINEKNDERSFVFVSFV